MSNHHVTPSINDSKSSYVCAPEGRIFGNEYYHFGETECWECKSPLKIDVDISDIYDQLPKSEKTLIKHYWEYNSHLKHSNVRISNDMGKPCDYYIYHNEQPIGLVIYYKGRKLTLHGIKQPNEQTN